MELVESQLSNIQENTDKFIAGLYLSSALFLF